MTLITGICVWIGRKFTHIGYVRAKREFHAANPGRRKRLYLEGRALMACNGDTIVYTEESTLQRHELHVTAVGREADGRRYADGWSRPTFEQPEVV